MGINFSQTCEARERSSLKLPLRHGETLFLTWQSWLKFMEIRTIIILDAPVLLVSRTIQNSQFRVLLHIIVCV